jgi:hypothetical protein
MPVVRVRREFIPGAGLLNLSADTLLQCIDEGVLIGMGLKIAENRSYVRQYPRHFYNHILDKSKNVRFLRML